MNWPVSAILAALILVGLGAWLRAVAMTQANPDDVEPMSDYEPSNDNGWPGPGI